MSADMRLWSRDLIAEFLALYKSHTCLWKIKSDEYKNRKKKEHAYKMMVNFCKNNGIPEANRDFVVKKIQSLKGSFRKELRKVLQSQRSGGEVYKPGLWYYDMLLFTKDQENPDNFVNIDEQSQEFVKEETFEDEDPQSSSNYAETELERNNYEDQNKYYDQSTARKRKSSDAQPKPVTVNADVIKTNTKDLTEFEAVGINVAKKMAKMDPLQAIYAEAVINNVLCKGLLRKLTDDSTLCEGMCYRNEPAFVEARVSSKTRDNRESSSDS